MLSIVGLLVDGASVGIPVVGSLEGFDVREMEGLELLGRAVDFTVGMRVGLRVDSLVGTTVDTGDGSIDGIFEGFLVVGAFVEGFVVDGLQVV